MLKALLKKQFLEVFKGYFVNGKTGTARSKSGIIGYFVLFAAIMIMLMGMFYGMAMGIGKPFINTPLCWLYFTVMGTVSVLFGAFGSVFNTFAGLYLPKDNEQLLSMPIPVRIILVSRLSGVFGLSLLYSGVVWLPACCFYFFYTDSLSALSVIYSVLLLVFIALFVSVISCALGFVVALFSKRIKNKGIISAISVVLFIVVYYAVIFRIQSILKALVKNGEQFGNGIKKWGNLLYQLGNGASGDTKGFIVFAAVSVALGGVCFYILNKTFIRIATENTGEKKSAVKRTDSKRQSVKSALMKKEMKRFTSCTVYMLNTGLGIIMAPVAAIAAAVKYDGLQKVLGSIYKEIPVISKMVPVCIPLLVCLIIGMDLVTASSISLEGKSLWIYKSLPVSSADILSAKLNLHILLNTPSAVISVVVLGICFGLETNMIVLSAIFCFVFIRFTGALGLIFNLKFPNFSWTAETTPVKQSMPVFLSMLAGFLIPVITGAGYYFLYKKVEMPVYLCCAVVVMYVVTFYMIKYLKTKGAKCFDEL